MTSVKQKKLEYFKLNPKDIVSEIHESSSHKRLVTVKGIEFFCCPRVYPSEQFRTTGFLLETIRPYIKNQKVCDMGCGPGIVGLYALYHGASKVVQADINEYAVKNAFENKEYHEFLDKSLVIYLSNCFDLIPEEKYDVIIFNPPFHSDEIEISDPLEDAFFDPGYKTIRKFLKQAVKYSHEKTKIFIAFSNKGNVKCLESLFDLSIFRWSLFKIKNQNQDFDNRIYLLTLN